MGKVVNKRELAEVLGISERTLTDWQEEPGFPIQDRAEARGEANSYSTSAVIQWWLQRELSKVTKTDKQRRRLLEAQAEGKERENLVAAGKLISAEEAVKAIRKIAREFRDSLMAIPSLAAPEIEFDTDRRSIERKLDKRMRAALDNYACRLNEESTRIERGINPS